MRVNIVHPGAEELVYEIRGIVDFAKKIEATGVPIIWENIGDPIAKGEEIPAWIRKIIAREVEQNNGSYGYSPTKGMVEARHYLAKTRSAETGNNLDPENIIFFNGLGDAISVLYSWLSPFARVLGPNPAYPTHSSLEGAHARSVQPTYDLDPKKGWMPDMKDIRDKVHFDADVAGLLIINPDNPTGAVYPRAILEEMVAIAKEYKLFLVADEIYANLTYEPSQFISLAEVAGDVPTIIMRGLSKEVPWPGSRCGWAEFYNTTKDGDFARYVESIENAKMTEVCSTTLPQTVLPKILADSRYPKHLEKRRQAYQRRAKEATKTFSKHPHVDLVEPKGAFYLSITFKTGFLEKMKPLAAANPAAQTLLDSQLAKTDPKSLDKRFCYQLLAATGICTVPLTSGFNSSIPGFRMTLLESDDKKFTETLQKIKEVL